MSGRILIADGSSSYRIVLKSKLTSAYYEVCDATTGEHTLLMARHEAPDGILLGMEFPDLDGFSICRILKADPLTAHIPIIICAASESCDSVRGLEAGADDFLSRPFDDVALFARVRSLMRIKHELDELTMRNATSSELGLQEFLGGELGDQDGYGLVQIVPGSLKSGMEWAASLQTRMYSAIRVSDSEVEALRSSKKNPPDAILVSANLVDGGDGLRLIAYLRSQAETRHAATILVVRKGDFETAAKALDLGATDFIEEPFDINELVARLRTQIKRKRASDKLRLNLRDGMKLAITDPLTGIFNRRYAASHLRKIMSRAQECDQPFAVMMLDLDKFKRVNDRYGHDAGDEVLQEFARRLQANIRSVDLVARLGGEEFFVAMPDASAKDASHIAERIRQAVEGRPFMLPNSSKAIRVTVSIGVAVIENADQTPAALMKQADLALFASKHAGRNCVRFHSEAA